MELPVVVPMPTIGMGSVQEAKQTATKTRAQDLSLLEARPPLPCPALGLTINFILDGSEYNEVDKMRPREMLRWSDIILPPEYFPSGDRTGFLNQSCIEGA